MNPATPVRYLKRVLTAAQTKALVGAVVPPSEPTITDPGLYCDEDTGEPVVFVSSLDADVRAFLRREILALKWGTLRRLGIGFSNTSRTFGFMPQKVTQRREGCSSTALVRDAPAASAALVEAGSRMFAQLREALPAVAERSMREASAVLPSWRLSADVPWTSGNINLTSQLPYHYDKFNLPVWSGMPTFKRGVEGGHLGLPEYGEVAAVRDGNVLHFAGYSLLHGVTPFRVVSPGGYRISVVYYALAGMKDCHTAAVEEGVRRQRRTVREGLMAAKVRDQG